MGKFLYISTYMPGQEFIRVRIGLILDHTTGTDLGNTTQNVVLCYLEWHDRLSV